MHDGEARITLGDPLEAMNLAFDFDDCWLHFRKTSAPKAHTVYIVLGNGGWDAIADHSSGYGATAPASTKR